MILQVYSPSSPTVTLCSCRDALLWSNPILSTTEPSLYTCTLPSSKVYTMFFSACLSTMFHSIVRVLQSTNLDSLLNRQLTVTSVPTKTLSFLVSSAEEPENIEGIACSAWDTMSLQKDNTQQDKQSFDLSYTTWHGNTQKQWSTLTSTVQNNNYDFYHSFYNLLLALHWDSDVTLSVHAEVIMKVNYDTPVCSHSSNRFPGLRITWLLCQCTC